MKQEVEKYVKQGLGNKKIAEKLNTTEWRIRKIRREVDGDGNTISNTVIFKKTPEFETVKPLEINITFPKSLKATKQKNIKTAIIIPDIQCGFRKDITTGKLTPFHDRRALDLALQITKHANPDRIVFLGDNLDLPEWSNKFVISPEFLFTTQPSIVELGWIYSQFRLQNPNAKIDVICGNHDHRATLAIINNLKASYGLRPADDHEGLPLMSMENLLCLNKLNITYHGNYPQGEVWLNENFRLHHGETVRSGSGKTVSAVVNDSRTNEAFGHIHRMEMASKTVWSFDGPKTYSAYSFSTLASIKPGVVPGSKSHQNWQNGLGAVQYEDGNGFSTVTPVLFYDNVAIYDGMRFEARKEEEIVSHLIKDTKYVQFK